MPAKYFSGMATPIRRMNETPSIVPQILTRPTVVFQFGMPLKTIPSCISQLQKKPMVSGWKTIGREV
jgi:hypothetical protein